MPRPSKGQLCRGETLLRLEGFQRQLGRLSSSLGVRPEICEVWVPCVSPEPVPFSKFLIGGVPYKQCDVPGIAVRSLLLLGGRLSEIPVI